MHTNTDTHMHTVPLTQASRGASTPTFAFSFLHLFAAILINEKLMRTLNQDKTAAAGLVILLTTEKNKYSKTQKESYNQIVL